MAICYWMVGKKKYIQRYTFLYMINWTYSSSCPTTWCSKKMGVNSKIMAEKLAKFWLSSKSLLDQKIQLLDKFHELHYHYNKEKVRIYQRIIIDLAWCLLKLQVILFKMKLGKNLFYEKGNKNHPKETSRTFYDHAYKNSSLYWLQKEN